MTRPYRAARAALNMIPGRVGRWRIAVAARPEHRGNLAAVGYDTLSASTIPICLLAPGAIALFGIPGGTDIDPTLPRGRFLECLCPTNRGRHPHAYTPNPTTLHLLQARASQIGPSPVRISARSLETYFGELQSRPGNQYRQGAELLRLFNRTMLTSRPTWPDIMRLFAAGWSPAADGDVASVPDILTRVHAAGDSDDRGEESGADDGVEESGEDAWPCDHCGATDDLCGVCTECYDDNGEECTGCGRSVVRGD